MTKKPSEKNKTWEKERRDRLNKAFEELAKLLPQYDPTVNWSKNDIIQKTIAYVSNMQEKHEKLLENHDPKALDDYKQLWDTLKFFRSRNSQLAELLTKAKITIPPAKFPKYITENPLVADEDCFEFKPRPVGRPKKYSSIEKCSSKDKERKQSSEENFAGSEVTLAESKTLTTTTENTAAVLKNCASSDPIKEFNLAATNDPTTLVQTSTNAIISTGVLIPVISCQPAILPQVNAPTLLVATNEASTASKCKILSIETLPRLNRFPKKLAKCKDGQVKILPYPVLRLHVRRGDNKVAIPCLKRDVITVKRKHRRRKRQITVDTNEINRKKRKISASDCPQTNKIKDLTKYSQISEVTLEKNEHRNIQNEDHPEIGGTQLNFSADTDATSKNDNRLSLSDNVLADEYFSTLQIPETNPNSTSVSPTAAFLLTFPVVNPGGGGKNVSEIDDSVDNHQQKHLNSISDGLENLNNFFKSKDYYGYCSQGYDLSEKVLYDKIDTSIKCLGDKDKFNNNTVQKEAILPLNPKTNSNIDKPPTLLPNSGNSLCENPPKTSEIKEKPAPISKQTPVSKTDSITSIGSLTTCQARTASNPKLAPLGSTAKPLISTKQEINLPVQLFSQTSKSTTFSSDFSMSSIFTSIPSTTAALPVSESSTKCIENTVKMSAQNSLFSYPALNTLPITNEKIITESSYSFNKPLCFPSSSSTHSMKGSASRLTKINPIPNPIPAALPQPSNFPTNYSFYLNQEKPPLPTGSHYQGFNSASKSRSNFDVNSVFLNYPGNSFQVSESSTIYGSNDKSKEALGGVKGGKGEFVKEIVSNIVPNLPVQGKASHSSLLKQNPNGSTSSKYEKPCMDSSFVIENRLSSLPQTSSLAKTDPKPALLGAPNVTVSTSSYSKTASKIVNTSKTTFPQISQLPSGNSCVAFTKNLSLSEINPAKKSEQMIPNNRASSLLGMETASCQFPMGFLPTSNYGYAPMAPETNSVFTFNLTSTSSTSVTTTAGTCQSQTFFPYSNANQNAHLNSCSATLDFQTPFTFSLTSTSSTNPTTSQISTNSYTKPNFSLDDLSINKTFNSVSNTSFNPFPELALPNTSYSSSSLAFNPTLASNKTINSGSEIGTASSCYPATNFTFSLARPQTTTTTATSEFLKPQASCSANDPKYQPFFNTYNYDSYSHVYPREATTFTFALTNPTDSVSSSLPSDLKTSQRFSSSFSIDTTLGGGKPYSFQNQQIALCDTNTQSGNQNFETQQKNVQMSKQIHSATIPTSTKPSLEYQPQVKHAKTPQKSHVNWMTSSQTSANLDNNQQHCSYYPSYPTGGGDANFSNMAMEDILPSWSPSKILDTSHLFQSAPVNPYYNEINYSIANANAPPKVNTDDQKPHSKPSEAREKPDKVLSKPLNSDCVSSQGKFLSVSQLVDQNAPTNSKPHEEHPKKSSQTRGKESRKIANITQNAYTQQKVTTRNNYSAEALISKKEKHRYQFAPSTIHHLHNPDYYHLQNDSMNNVHPLVDSDNINYNSNYYYNFMPANQSYVQDMDYLGAYPGDDANEKANNYSNRKASRLASNSKINKKPPSTLCYLPNLTTSDLNQPAPSVAPLASVLDSFETIHCNSFQQNGNWNEGKTGIGNDAVLPGCNHPGVGNPGSNLTNFNLSTICPEISGKVASSNGNW